MRKPTEFSAVRSRSMRILRPSTNWGRATLWFGAASVLLVALRGLTGSASDSKLNAWAVFLTIASVFCASWLSIRFAWRHAMWRLRHRLIITYIFIGVIPIVLLLLMAVAGTLLFAGQFATYLAISDLQSALRHLQASNDGLAAQLHSMQGTGRSDERIAGEVAAVSAESFPQRTITVWRGNQGVTLSREGAVVDAHPAEVPNFIKRNFAGFVIDGDRLHLRAVKRYQEGGSGLTLVSNVPITPELLSTAASRLGAVTLMLPDRGGGIQVPPPARAGPHEREQVHAGHIPPASNRFDATFNFFTLFAVSDWQTGKSQTSAVSVVTRLSILYATLLGPIGENTVVLQYGLLVIGLFFAVIELLALFIGIRISRSITQAVAELYSATRHVERGDLVHRIDVRGRDQLAELEHSFNSMTESLAKLVTEQKEKHRLESELAIAHEVQNLLFPRNFEGLPSLEVYGVCRPARTVSGDYYDFISTGGDKLVLAVGDISGKGISAALLMATLHAFVRAYSLEPDMVSASPVSEVNLFSEGERRMYYRGNRTGDPDSTVPQLAPGILMTTVNYQLFRSTPLEKYATMFVGCYDASVHELKYCNAGHVPPILLRADGEVSRLETSGTVVGLFDHATYSESIVSMKPDDIVAVVSDGVTEPENERGEFGEQRLIELIREHRHEPLSRIGEVITEAVSKWIGDAEQPDDLTVVLARAR